MAGNNGKPAGIDLDPGALYTLQEAAALVSNVRTERPVTVNALRYWRRQGRLRVVKRSLGARHYYLVCGSGLLEAIAARAGFQVKVGPKKGRKEA